MALMRLSPDLDGSLDGSVFKNCLIGSAADCSTGQSEFEGERLSGGQTGLVDSRTPLLTACRSPQVMGSAPDLMMGAGMGVENRKSVSTRRSTDYDDPYTYILSEGRPLSNGGVSVSSSSYLVTSQDAKTTNISSCSNSSSCINLCNSIDACASDTQNIGSL